MTQQDTQALFQQAAQFDRSTLKERVTTAERQRAEIQRLFPLADWPSLALERYALGVRTEGGTYCHWLEFNSQELGGIGGGSALKHVIYKKKDGSGWYYPKEYADENQSWQAVRAEFNRALDLVRVGDLIAIDQLPNLGNKASLAKTLHIYFPNDILPIYSSAHLVYFLEHLSVPASQYELLGRIQQNRLLQTTLRARPEFDGWSNVEIAFFLYEVSRPGEPRFGAPFDKMFTDREEADWALDMFSNVVRQLGCETASDPLFALTYSRNGNSHYLTLNYGQWAVLGMTGSKGQLVKILLALFPGDYPGQPEPFGVFKRTAGEHKVGLYRFPIESARPLAPETATTYADTLSAIRTKFEGWRSSPWKPMEAPGVLEAVLAPERRAAILATGLPDRRTDISVEAEGIPGDANPLKDHSQLDLVDRAPFTSRTFELLELIHKNPTATTYSDHKTEFQSAVEEPVREILRRVAERLPPAITRNMETSKRVLSRFLTNRSKGGAHDYFWGAYYPNGTSRIQGAQLYVWINRERLEIGFHVAGDEARGQFTRNLKRYQTDLVELLKELDASTTIRFLASDKLGGALLGSSPAATLPVLRDLVANPAAADYGARVGIGREDVLRMDGESLDALAVETFGQVYPLVLLATQDDPLPKIREYLGASDEETDPEPNPVYSLESCAADLCADVETIQTWVRHIERRRQAVLYGPPGTGKTFAAGKLAKLLVSGGDGFVELIQFHPAYAYEDFIQGLRPQARPEGGLDYVMVKGRFLEFCDKARTRKGRCVLILDEFNRANLARVLGELMYLLEYRDEAAPLAGGGTLSIPANVVILGTMNTADRSIALVDHALRRRFAFIAVKPNYDSLRRYHARTNAGFDPSGLIDVLEQVTREIGDPNYALGVSFFMLPGVTALLPDIWRAEIEPYLEEYFFDKPGTVSTLRWDKVKARILNQPAT